MEILEQVKDIVKPQYDTLDCWVHSWPHVEKVTANTDLVASAEGHTGQDYVNCMVSAYCHDLGRIEEEARKQRGDGALPHALFSIEPTVDILREVGISGVDFAKIVEAVAVHSYRVYDGPNEVAKILQDGDKMNGFGPFGIIGAVKYFGGKDYVSPKNVVENRDNREVLHELCLESFRGINELPVKTKTLKGLGFVIEWYDMLHTDSAKKLIKEEYKYTKEMKKYLEMLP